MLQTYLMGVIIFGGISILLTFIAAGAHFDYRDRESAGNLKFMLAFTLSTLVWPLLIAGGVGAAFYILFKSVWDVLTKDYA